ncbi:MAG: phosphotransferase [Actinobacteria bacterium]|nr:phosphotransferase [Actinomycetota bacterium]
MAILHGPADLTADLLTESLRASDALVAGEVVSFACTPIGTGQMGDAFRVSLDYAGDAAGAPATVVAKFATTDEGSRAAGLVLRAYEIEVNVYRTVAARLELRTPRCFHADVDPTTGWFTLLLEDMAPAVQGDQLAGLSAEQVEHAAVALAGLHGPCWRDPGLASLEWLNRHSEEVAALTAMLVSGLFPGFVERYGEQLTCDELDVTAHLMDRLVPYFTDRPGTMTVTHGDYRPDNFLLGDAGSPAPFTVVDWQTAAWGPPMPDVAYAVALGFADPAERALHEERIVRRYHEALVAHGVADLSWDDCWLGYRRGSFHNLVMTVAPAMLVERTARGDEMFLASLRRGVAQIRDLDALDLLP